MTTIQINDNIAFAPKAAKLPKLLFLACWSLVPEQQVAGGGKKGKNDLGVIASPLPHSIFSICTPVKGHLRPLLNHIFFCHASNLNFPMFQIWRMNCHLCDRLFFLTFLHSSTTFPMDVMEGLDNQVDCGRCKVVQMNKLQFDLHMYC